MQAWERRSFWETGQIWSKARHGRIGIEHSTTLETKGLMPIRWARDSDLSREKKQRLEEWCIRARFS